MATPRAASPRAMPLRPAMSTGRESDDPMSPRSGPKVVSIAEPESISPLMQAMDGQSRKQFNAGVARRLSGRPPPYTTSSRTSIVSQKSPEELPEPALPVNQDEERANHHHHHQDYRKQEKLLARVAEWLQIEKSKMALRKARKIHSTKTELLEEGGESVSRPSSRDSELSLDKLQKILEGSIVDFGIDSSASPNLQPRPPHTRRRSSTRKLMRTASSDTEYHDGDVIVPSCDVILDNSKTLSYSGGVASASDVSLAATGRLVEKERKSWSIFKSEILRLAHTLRLKGWRRVPLENGDAIDVERLSGALTNAVYAVSLAEDLPPPNSLTSSGVVPKRRPPKLLLRIYGPQVEHLIDRENELGILRRLARKKIGPRLLGTFKNGRFEEFFDSTTLTSADLRVPETSKQIAKRMRELHDGVELLEQERQDGPFVWRNWDKWVDRCERVITYLDDQIVSGRAGPVRSKLEGWKLRGLVCGVEWSVFRMMIDKYRNFLIEHYGGEAEVRKQLVFAHNDTQYGNILRLKPSGESPLLLPANTHKQLVVIDFEYASANTPGFEFANHFTEWCYNYHDPVVPYACNTHNYPSEEEQRRFIKAYVNHRPQFNPRASATPASTPSAGPGSSISEFLLDSRTPSGISTYAEEEAQRENYTNEKVKELMKEARLWRIANSAQWVAWGIVQAKVPELDDPQLSTSPNELSPALATPTSETSLSISELTNGSGPSLHNNGDKRPEGLIAEALLSGQNTNDIIDEDGEFDYLGYAQERAMFFWGDAVALGLVKKEELPGALWERLKVVPY